MTRIVEPAKATSTVQKSLKNMKIWSRKWGWGYCRPEPAPVPNRPAPAPARISSCALTAPHTLGGIIVVLNRLSSSLQNNQKIWRFDLVKKVEDISMRWIAQSSAWQLFPGGRWTSRTEYPTYFERHNCSPESTELNASKIIEKYEGSIQ